MSDEGVNHTEAGKPLAVLKILAVKNAAARFKRCGKYQRVIPTYRLVAREPQGLNKKRTGGLHSEQRNQSDRKILFSLNRSHWPGKTTQGHTQELRHDRVAQDTFA